LNPPGELSWGRKEVGEVEKPALLAGDWEFCTLHALAGHKTGRIFCGSRREKENGPRFPMGLPLGGFGRAAGRDGNRWGL